MVQESVVVAREHCISTATPPAPDFNVGMWVFPVKKLLPSDLPGTTDLARATLEARPLAMKCCDKKGHMCYLH